MATDNKLYIVRGIPGSGKSTIAKKLLQDGLVSQVVEADEFMTDDKGNYKFDAGLLQKNHQMCQMWVRYYLDKGLSVAVANTFTRKWEISIYTKMGYTYEVVEAKGNYKSVHDVSPQVISQMKKRWENWN